MSKIHVWFGALIVATTFAACGDDEDDGSGGGGTSTGGSAGKGGSTTGGSAGKGGTAGSAGTGTGGTAGKGGTGGKGGTAGGGAGGAAGMGGEGGEAGGMGGEGGETPAPCDATATPAIFIGELSGAQEVPANASTGTGNAVAELNAAETELTVSAYWAGLGSNTYIGHIHGPAAAGVNAPVLFDLMPPTGAVSGQVVAKVFAINAAQVAYLKAGQLYANIHSDTLMAGEIRAQLLAPLAVRSGTLSGTQEVPSNTSAGTGRAVAVVFPGGDQVAVSVNWTGLTGNATVGHVHGPAAIGVNASVAFDLTPPTVAAGSVVHKIWQVTAQNNQDLLNGLMYANIHSAMYPAGEIRAQLLPQCD